MNEKLNLSAGSSAGEGDVPAAILRRSLFWWPIYLVQSPRLEHLPFAFWLVEAQRPRAIVELGTRCGASYFAFCQAVRQLALGTACYAIDSWRGEEHAESPALATMREHNRMHYSGFSTLLPLSFGDALERFADGSIDLLHIDNHHSYESVRDDFEGWRPKLSDEAVVVLHDTNARTRGAGASRLFGELKDRYPSFEFIHGDGLGVLGVGRRWQEPVAWLFQAEKDRTTKHAVQAIFSRLGAACSDAFAAQAAREECETLKAQLSEARKRAEADALQLSNERQANATLRQDLDVQVRNVAALELGMAERFRELAVVTRRLAQKEAELTADAENRAQLKRRSVYRRLKKTTRRSLTTTTWWRRRN